MFTWDNKVSLGHVLTAGALLATIIVSWTTTNGRVAAIEVNDARQDSRLEALAGTVGDIRQIQIEQGVDIRYIRAFVEDERRNARTAATE